MPPVPPDSYYGNDIEGVDGTDLIPDAAFQHVVQSAQAKQMKLITSLEDGYMLNFKRMMGSGGVGFVGYEKLLYLSLCAALERRKENPIEEVKVETDDESTG